MGADYAKQVADYGQRHNLNKYQLKSEYDKFMADKKAKKEAQVAANEGKGAYAPPSEQEPREPVAPGLNTGDGGLWDQTQSGYSPVNPFGPSPNEQIQTMGAADSAMYNMGYDLSLTSGAKAAEVLYPYQRDAYNQAMQQKAVVGAFDSLAEFKDDPILNKTAALVSQKLENPFTFDDATTSAMRTSMADTIAQQEAATMQRMQMAGAQQGISPGSPQYAAWQQQAIMARDINMANAERQLQIQMAQQKQMDIQQSVALGSQFGGAYQSMLGQKQANVQNLQMGGKVADLGNPFAGLWQGMLAEQQMQLANSQGGVYGGGGSGSAEGNFSGLSTQRSAYLSGVQGGVSGAAAGLGGAGWYGAAAGAVAGFTSGYYGSGGKGVPSAYGFLTDDEDAIPWF